MIVTPEVARNVQALLCAPWNVRPVIPHESEIVVLAQNTLIIVDPNGIAVVHIEGYGIEGAI